MPFHPNGKNISIHFTQDELTLLDEFEKYRKQNYINRSGWVKQHMKKALTENKRQLTFGWNENPKYQSIDDQNAGLIPKKKSKSDIKKYLDQ